MALMMFDTKTVYGKIKLFLQSKALKSENTATAYETDIKQFFMTTLGKKLEELEQEDIRFEHSEVMQYQLYLVESGLANSSVNRKMNAVHSLFMFLKRDDANINADAFIVDTLSESESDSYGVLTVDEVFEMIERVKKQYKGLEKSLLVEMALRTSFRKESLLSLKWDDIVYNEAEGLYIVTVIGKGKKKSEKPIPDSFYQRLLVLKYNRKAGDGLVFHLDSKTPDAMITSLCEEMGISKERNVKFHSLKKTLINWSIDMGLGAVVAAQQGDHSKLDTMYKYYLDRKKNLGEMPGMQVDASVNTDVLEGLSKEELLEVIKSSSLTTKYEITKQAKKKGASK